VNGPTRVLAADGPFQVEVFLVDTCADRTVFRAGLLGKLQLRTTEPTGDMRLEGVGGHSPHVLATTTLEFIRDDGGPARVHGQFAAFTDPAATDLSILVRDVLDIFDVIVSKQRQQVLLLAGNHEHRVEPV